jgi:integrase/recombinase XerD
MSPSAENSIKPGGQRAPTDLERELERYLRYVTLERGRSKNTVAAYRSDLQRYLESLSGSGVSAPAGITAARVSNYVNGLFGSETTVARKLSSIKNFHRF